MVNYTPYEVTMNNYREILEKHFIYIGVVEDMQTSVNELADKLGFPTVDVEHLNSSEWDEEISVELKQKFKLIAWNMRFMIMP